MSDKEIIGFILDESRRDYGFSLLVENYQERLYWVIRRMVVSHEDADDILQNTFIKVWKGIPGFKQEAQLFTWLYRIASNETFSYLKKNKKHLQLVSIDDGSAEEASLAEKLEADPYFDGEKAEKVLAEAMDKLPAKQKLVFQLRFYDSLTYRQISEVLETSEGALKASYHHAVKKIEKHIESY